MKLLIQTAEKKHFEGDVARVRLPGALNSFEVLKGHQPIVSTLTKGKIVYQKASGERVAFPIERGIVEVGNKITVYLF